MLDPYTLNIQESLIHAWHEILVFEVLGSESVIALPASLCCYLEQDTFILA